LNLQVTPNVVNSVLMAFDHIQDHDSVIKWFNYFDQQGLKIPTSSYVTIFRAFKHKGETQMIFNLYEKVKSDGILLPHRSYAALRDIAQSRDLSLMESIANDMILNELKVLNNLQQNGSFETKYSF